MSNRPDIPAVGFDYKTSVQVSGQDEQSDNILATAINYKTMLDELGSIEAVAEKSGNPVETVERWIGLADLVVFLRRL